MPHALAIRRAEAREANSLVRMDHVAHAEPRRAAFLSRSIAAGTCWVAEQERTVLGFGILEYSFYDYGFVPLLYVDAERRRQGVGTALLRHLEARCETPKLFTSTNASNLPMQRLLAKLGYSPSGVIHNLDPGDPELVYVKYLAASTEPGPPAA